MTPLDLLLAALACWRLTRLITTDVILEPVRQRLGAHPTAAYLAACWACTSMWMAAAIVAGWALLPRPIWTAVVTALALSAAVTITAARGIR